MDIDQNAQHARVPWNKGKLAGQKPPLRAWHGFGLADRRRRESVICIWVSIVCSLNDPPLVDVTCVSVSR
ncbi:MAG: hypothetical protein H0U72_12915 [Nitrosospira sp.]|nr:hypothetical protein [Nitrosospira sp.]